MNYSKDGKKAQDGRNRKRFYPHSTGRRHSKAQRCGSGLHQLVQAVDDNIPEAHLCRPYSTQAISAIGASQPLPEARLHLRVNAF
jgi:hypothetical protein